MGRHEAQVRDHAGLGPGEAPTSGQVRDAVRSCQRPDVPDFPPVPATVEEARAPFACPRLALRVQSARCCVAAFVAAQEPATVEDGARVVDRRVLCRGCPSGAARLALLGNEPAPRAPVRRRPAERTEDGQPDAEVRRVMNGVRARAAAQAERAIRAAAEKKNARRAQVRAVERAGRASVTTSMRLTGWHFDDPAPVMESEEAAPVRAQEVPVVESEEAVTMQVGESEPVAMRLAASARDLAGIDQALRVVDVGLVTLQRKRATLLERRSGLLADVEAAVAALRGGA